MTNDKQLDAQYTGYNGPRLERAWKAIAARLEGSHNGHATALKYKGWLHDEEFQRATGAVSRDEPSSALNSLQRDLQQSEFTPREREAIRAKMGIDVMRDEQIRELAGLGGEPDPQPFI